MPFSRQKMLLFLSGGEKLILLNKRETTIQSLKLKSLTPEGIGVVEVQFYIQILLNRFKTIVGIKLSYLFCISLAESLLQSLPSSSAIEYLYRGNNNKNLKTTKRRT